MLILLIVFLVILLQHMPFCFNITINSKTLLTLPFLSLLTLVCIFGMSARAHAAPSVLGLHGNISKVKRYPATSEILATPDNLPAELANISARSAIIMDDASNRIYFAKSPDEPRQPASTLKILTGTIALNALTGDEIVPVSREAASRPSSKMYLDPAKQYRADELISAVLLASANDASVALAELLAGTEQEFANYMTMQAQYWGANNTNCKNATGLTAKDQASTARDLARIFREAMRNPNFAAKMKTRSMITDEGNKLYNHNKALWQISGTVGGKTGYTQAARQTYVGKFTNDKGSFIVAILGSETMWHDLKRLVKYGFSRYQYMPSVPKKNLAVNDIIPGEKGTGTTIKSTSIHN